MERPPVVVILVGAGAGRRLGGDEAKAFRSLGGRPLLAVAASVAADCPGVERLVAVVPAGREEEARRVLADVPLHVEVVPGGEARQDSVRAGLASASERAPLVLVHDVARPFASADLYRRVVTSIDPGVDAVAPVVPVTDTVLRVRGGVVTGVEPRDELSFVQTPQGFRTDVLREAHAKAEAAGFAFTDDATLAQWAGFEVRTIDGEAGNVKITTPSDLADAERRAGGGDG
jgi:2-C-methyl-D-erythritol 4-phosphate cytidylyltransferase